MTNDEKFSQAKTEQSGKARYGDRWQAAIDAIGRQGGVSEANMRQIVTAPDAAGLLYNMGKEALLHQSDNGDTESERLYRQLRADEREQFRRDRGR